MYTVKINGVKYIVENGVYDPPLPPERIERDKRVCQDMLESGKAPGHRSDTSFHAGRGSLLTQLEGDENWAKHLGAQAKKRGVNLSGNEVYIGQLDDAHGGNPDAFFKPGEGLAEMKRRLQKSGKGVDMPGLYVAPTAKPQKKHALNPKITKQLMQQYRNSGEASGKSNAELKQYVEKKHGRPD